MAEAGENLNPRAMHEAKAELAAEVEEGAKAVLVTRVEQETEAGREARAGLTVGVGVRAEVKSLM